MGPLVKSSPEQLVKEFENFEEIARGVMPRPGSIPSLAGVEVYGDTISLNGIVGGDHLIYVDFNKRHDLEARIKLAEEAGRGDCISRAMRIMAASSTGSEPSQDMSSITKARM